MKPFEEMTTSEQKLYYAALAGGFILTEGSKQYRTFLCKGGTEWNPEESNADSLELLASLKGNVTVKSRETAITVKIRTPSLDGDDIRAVAVTWSGDRSATLRRAIFKAAVALGKHIHNQGVKQ